tara:strand:- start:2294 stop:3691 length:1398 start_codon:yes stop_codon:yes gene_type:complete
MFAAWFASGIVMIYVPFPSLSDAERIKRAEVVDVSGVTITSLSESLVATGINITNRIRLLQYQRRPMLVVEGNSNDVVAVFADSAELIRPLTPTDASVIAEKFSSASVLSVSDPILYDQWVVHDRFDPYRPFFRVELEDEARTHLYISTKTTEVLQKTNRQQRVWNYVGAVVHWIYPTIIRKDWALWDQLVWWVSLFGILGVIAGMILGIKHSVAGWKRGSKGLASPFSGWLAWHHKIGFVFGVFALLWIFSGWLSMDHGRLFSTPAPSDKQKADVRGISLTTALSQASQEDLSKFLDTREFEISALAGQALLIAKNDQASELSLIGMDLIPDQQYLIPAVQSAVSQAWPSITIKDSYMVAADDVYGHLREGSLPESTLRVVLDDVDETWVHVNLNEGRIISVMDKSRRMYRWLFNGIHSLDLPGLTDKRPLWDVLMVLLMAVGFIFSVTGIVIAYRKLVRLLVK